MPCASSAYEVAAQPMPTYPHHRQQHQFHQHHQETAAKSLAENGSSGSSGRNGAPSHRPTTPLQPNKAVEEMPPTVPRNGGDQQVRRRYPPEHASAAGFELRQDGQSQGNRQNINRREKSDLGQAESYYKKAINEGGNEFLEAYYMKKLGLLYQSQGKMAEAKGMFEQIKNKYPLSPDGQGIDKYISRVSGN